MTPRWPRRLDIWEQRTKKDTVNAALREIIDRRRRAEAIARMRALVASGEIELPEGESTRPGRESVA